MQLCEEVILYLKFLTSNFKIFILPFSQKFKYIINNTSDSVHSITTNICDKFSYINKQCEQYVVSNWKRRQCMNNRRLGADGLSKIHRSGPIFWLSQVPPLPGRIFVEHIPATCTGFMVFQAVELKFVEHPSALLRQIFPASKMNVKDTSVLLFKWHLGMFAKEYTPTYRGFHSHYGYYQGMEDYWEHTYEATTVCIGFLKPNNFPFF